MTQFVRKTLLGGFAEVPGGQNDPECSHVLMDREEYDRMLRYISEKEWAVTQARNEGDNALAMANRSAREALAQAEKEAGERLQALRQELEAEKDESAYQRALNANLLRINRERANAERGLRPKKTRPGYIVLYSEEKDYPYRDGRKLIKVKMWETTLQSPYPTGLAEAAARRQLEEDLFSEENEWLSAAIGITGRYLDDYEKMRVEKHLNPNDPFFQGNIALATLQRLKRNFRSGYWEVSLLHTKPLGDIPEELLPERKKTARET